LSGISTIHVYYQGQKPDCPYLELGVVEVASTADFFGTELGTFEASVAKLQRSAAQKGATAVLILDHGKYRLSDYATGMAIACKSLATGVSKGRTGPGSDHCRGSHMYSPRAKERSEPRDGFQRALQIPT
jgi:hypothetical protein